MAVRKNLKQRPGERNRFLENRPPLPKDKFKLKNKKPRIGEGVAGVKRKAKAKSAKEIYDSKRKSFRKSKVENFGAGGVVKKVAKTILRDDYKPKLKNEKEVYSRVKQDYSDVIKNYEKTQKRKKRNRAALVVGGAATAAAIQSKKDKQKKK